MKWKIHQQSYIGMELVEAGQEKELGPIGHDRDKKLVQHLPGPHWEPADDEAKAFAKSIKHRFTGQMPDVDTPMTAALSAARDGMERQGAGVVIDHDKLGAAIAAGIAATLPAALVAALQAMNTPAAEPKAA